MISVGGGRGRVSAWVYATVVGAAGCGAASSFGTIAGAGDLEPANPAWWTPSGAVTIGNASDGSVRVDGASVMRSFDSYLGYQSGVTGTVRVDGAD